MKQWKTYGKRGHLLPPKQEFIDDEKGKAALPLLSTPRKQNDNGDNAGDDLLVSPVLSDNSSSIKSIEPAMERRVSLLLRGELPDESIKLPHPFGSLLDSSPAPEQMADPLTSIMPEGKPNRDTNLKPIREPVKATPQSTSDNPIQHTPTPVHRTSAFNKRISAIWSRQPSLNHDSEEQTISRIKGKEKGVSRASGPFVSGLGAGRKILERAKSAVTKSPSKSGKPRRDKVKELRHLTDKDELLINVPEMSPTTAVYSPSSLFFDAPDIEVEPWVPTEKTRVPSRPYMNTFTGSSTGNRKWAKGESHLPDSTSPPLIRVVEAEPDSPLLPVIPGPRDNARKYTEDCQKLTVADSARLSALEPTVSVSLSIEDSSSGSFGFVQDPKPEHKLRHMTAKIKRQSMLSSRSSNSTMNASRHCRSINESPLSGERRQNIPVETSENSSKMDKPSRRNKPLGEGDPNRLIHRADEGTIRLAKAIRVSVSPKVREVFNKFPKKTMASPKPVNFRGTDEVLSRSSSKASHILGHHVGSREPLRPPRGDQDVAVSFREDLSSEDELAM